MNRPSYAIKAAISAALLLVLWHGIEPGGLVRVTGAMQWRWLLAAFALVLLIRFVMAYRWQVVLRGFGLRPAFRELLYIVFVSNSIGHLLPGGVGTDIVRGCQLSAREGMPERVAASVVLDRVYGLASMLGLALAASLAGVSGAGLPAAIPLVIAGVTAGAAVSLYLLAGMVRGGRGRFSRGLAGRVAGFAGRTFDALTGSELRGRARMQVVALSLLVQAIRCVVFLLLFRALGSTLEPVLFFIFIPVLFILMLLPVSIGGLGVRESALFLFFAPYGETVASCTVAGLSFHLLQLAALVPGLFLFVLRKPS